jgi:hypothetical protein
MKRYFAGALVLFLAASCGSDSLQGPVTLPGSYTPESVTIRLQRSGQTFTLKPPAVSGSLSLTQNRYTVVNIIPSMSINTIERGSYTRTGSNIVFIADNGTEPFTGSVSLDGRKLTLFFTFVEDNEVVSITYVFARL